MGAVSLVISRITFDEVEECWQLDQLCFADGETYEKHTFEELVAYPDAVCLKCVGDSPEMLGFVIGVVEVDRTGHVVVLGVAPEFRRQNIGRTLMSHLEAEMAERGVRLLHLEVRTTNAGARALYEGIGYTVAGRRLGYYTNGDDGFLMVKSIA